MSLLNCIYITFGALCTYCHAARAARFDSYCAVEDNPGSKLCLGGSDVRRVFFSIQSWRLSSEQLSLVLHGMPGVNHTVGLAARLRRLCAPLDVCLRGSVSTFRATFRVYRQPFSHACLVLCR